MMTQSEVDRARARAAAMLDAAGVVLTPAERAAIEVADCGLSDIERTGAQILTYVNTARVCAKEIVLLPHQTCPEHRHPPFAGTPGKEETFRCRWGTVYLYTDGSPTPAPRCRPPRTERAAYTVGHEIVLQPGDQHTVAPGTRHWFQAGPQGAIVSEFSTRSRDDLDVFTDPAIRRATVVTGDGAAGSGADAGSERQPS